MLDQGILINEPELQAQGKLNSDKQHCLELSEELRQLPLQSVTLNKGNVALISLLTKYATSLDLWIQVESTSPSLTGEWVGKLKTKLSTVDKALKSLLDSVNEQSHSTSRATLALALNALLGKSAEQARSAGRAAPSSAPSTPRATREPKKPLVSQQVTERLSDALSRELQAVSRSRASSAGTVAPASSTSQITAANAGAMEIPPPPPVRGVSLLKRASPLVALNLHETAPISTLPCMDVMLFDDTLHLISQLTNADLKRSLEVTVMRSRKCFVKNTSTTLTEEDPVVIKGMIKKVLYNADPQEKNFDSIVRLIEKMNELLRDDQQQREILTTMVANLTIMRDGFVGMDSPRQSPSVMF